MLWYMYIHVPFSLRLSASPSPSPQLSLTTEREHMYDIRREAEQLAYKQLVNMLVYPRMLSQPIDLLTCKYFGECDGQSLQPCEPSIAIV